MEIVTKLHVLTGNGKGKTSAAVGMAARYAGHGGTVLFAQFLKDGTSGERNALKKLGVLLPEMPAPSGFFSQMTTRERRELAGAYGEAAILLEATILREAPGLVILDELSVALSLGVLAEAQGKTLVSASLSKAETVVTGRNAPSWLTDMADYVTECKAVRHPYAAEGLAARGGIEY